MAAMPLPLWFDDCMVGNSLGLYRYEPKYTVDQGKKNIKYLEFISNPKPFSAIPCSDIIAC